MSTHKSPPEQLQGSKDSHAKWLLHRIWERLNRKNEHFMGVIVGQEGSGKSYTAIKIAQNVDPSFTHERVIFNVADLLERLADGDHEPGQCYVLDEAGVQLGVRTWQDRAQILANQALQLVRKHNLGLIFTLPRLSELDSQAQGRLQAMYEITDKVNDEYVEGKWKFFDPDRTDTTGNIYKKYPRRIQDGNQKRITRISFTPPQGKKVEKYEAKKDEFLEAFYKETIAELRDEATDEEEDDDEMSAQELAEEVAEKVERYVSRHSQNKEPYIDKDLIRAEYDLSHSDAKTVKSLLERQFTNDELEQYV